MNEIELAWTLTLGALGVAVVVGGLTVWVLSMVARTARGDFDND
ncbi:hypothetical protein [Microbacterium lacus]|nr:hypothetical protein [Microbacterium lacus]